MGAGVAERSRGLKFSVRCPTPARPHTVDRFVRRRWRRRDRSVARGQARGSGHESETRFVDIQGSRGGKPAVRDAVTAKGFRSAVFAVVPIAGLMVLSACRAPGGVGAAADEVPARFAASLRYLEASHPARLGAVSEDAVDPASMLEDYLEDRVLPLEKARALTLAANPDIHAALSRLQAARARIAEARSRFLPTLQFSHTFTRTFHTPASRNRLNTLLQPAQSIPSDLDTSSLAVTTILNALRLPLFGAKPKGNTNPFSEHSTALTVTWTAFD
ncbi:MAG: hypothetical protein D6788_05185, partial [Planctomycetota bacterium]